MHSGLGAQHQSAECSIASCVVLNGPLEIEEFPPLSPSLQRMLQYVKATRSRSKAQLQKETAITYPFQRTLQTETMKRELKHREEERLRDERGLNSTTNSTMMRAVEILELHDRAYFAAFLVDHASHH